MHRRRMYRSLDVLRPAVSSTGDYSGKYGANCSGPSRNGLLADLRSGNGERESAGFYRDVSRRTERRSPAMELGVPAVALPGNLRALRRKRSRKDDPAPDQ